MRKESAGEQYTVAASIQLKRQWKRTISILWCDGRIAYDRKGKTDNERARERDRFFSVRLSTCKTDWIHSKHSNRVQLAIRINQHFFYSLNRFSSQLEVFRSAVKILYPTYNIERSLIESNAIDFETITATVSNLKQANRHKPLKKIEMSHHYVLRNVLPTKWLYIRINVNTIDEMNKTWNLVYAEID